MSRRQILIGIGLLAGVAWVLWWGWVFSFAYSNSYFSYSRGSRIPVFAATMFGVIAIPVGAFFLWRRFGSATGVIMGQAGVAFVSVIPLAATSFVLSRVSGPWHLSGDDAMGAGINFVVLSGTAAVSIVVMGIASIIRSRQRYAGRGSAGG